MNLNNLCGGLTILALLAGPTVAQQTPVYQDGKAVPGGAVKSVANGRINSAGGISSNANGQGFNLYNITDDQAPGLCINSAPPKAKYNALCIGHDKASDAVISLDSYGGMAAKELKLRLNGTAYTRPGSVAIVGSNAVAINNAALKVLQGAAGKRITRMGYYTPGDGGSVAYNWSDSNCAAADDGAQVQPTGITGCWIADFPGDNLDIRQFGADMTGAADSALAISRAFAASLGKSGSCVFVPAGVVRLASVVAVGAIPNPGQFCLRGNGHQSSILNWTSATGGITMTTAGQGTSFIIKGLSFTTTQAGGGAAVSITSTGAWGGGDANYNLFDDLWIGGDDKLILHDTNLHYWTEAIVTTGVSNVNMQNVGINGGGLRNGDGFRFEGGATCCALLLNVINSSFDNLVKGLIIGNLTQGYEVANTQFQNGDYEICSSRKFHSDKSDRGCQ